MTGRPASAARAARADALRRTQETTRPKGGPTVAAPKRFMADGTAFALEREAEAAAARGTAEPDIASPVHDGPASRQAAAALGARGFHDVDGIHLGPAAAAPASRRAIIAHEATHAVQARAGRTAGAVMCDRDPQLMPQVPAPRFYRSPIGLSLSVYFAQNSFLLGAAGQHALRDLQRELRLSPGATVRIDGYASAEGSAAYNLRLSEYRRMAVRALVASGAGPMTEIGGAAHGEAEAAETGVGVADRMAFRAEQRRVDIHVVHRDALTGAEPAPEPPINLRPVLTFRPETDQERLDRLLRQPRLPERPGPGTSVCGRWRDETRKWFDRRLRDLNVSGGARRWLADRGVGLVEDLPFRLIEQGLKGAKVDGDERRAMMSAIRAACKQEIR
jgi:outer membrane protein OmpA-like peptidoglycan-associated protein